MSEEGLVPPQKALCPGGHCELEERGRGLVATKRIATGDLMVRDEAVILFYQIEEFQTYV